MLDYHKQEGEPPSFHQVTKVFRLLDSTYAKKKQVKKQDVQSAEKSTV